MTPAALPELARNGHAGASTVTNACTFQIAVGDHAVDSSWLAGFPATEHGCPVHGKRLR